MMCTSIKAKTKRACVFPFSNAAHKLAFEPNRLNAGIKVAFRESMKAAFQQRREKVMIHDGI